MGAGLKTGDGIVSGRRVAVRSTACVQAARAKKSALSVRNHSVKLVRERKESSCGYRIGRFQLVSGFVVSKFGSVAVLHIRLRPVDAERGFGVPLSVLVLVFDVAGGAGRALLARGTLCGFEGRLVGGEGLGENVADRVGPALVVPDDLVGHMHHRSISLPSAFTPETTSVSPARFARVQRAAGIRAGTSPWSRPCRVHDRKGRAHARPSDSDAVQAGTGPCK